jgi:ion channel POLLUX/CASTOR
MKHRGSTFRQRIYYWFDNTMAHGTAALIGWLAVVSLALIVVFTIVLLVLAQLGLVPEETGASARNPVSAFWTVFLHAFSTDPFVADQGEWPFLVVMFGITLGGIFVLSTLIGILASGLSTRLDELRRGRSTVLETGHTLIIGWSDQVFGIIRQLATANAISSKGTRAGGSRKSQPSIVVLGPADKVEMEEAIKVKVGGTGKTRVLCRTGNPIDRDDLQIANPQDSHAIIVLAPGDNEPDSQVIKTVLALVQGRGREERARPYHIVALIREEENLAAARLAGGPDANFIHVGDLVSRLVAQTCRQSGLSIVYNMLLDFEDDAIYFKEVPALVGQSFGAALLAFEKCAVLGLQHARGHVTLNPPMDTVISPGDKVIAIAAHEDDMQVSTRPQPPRPAPSADSVPASREEPPTPEHVLILGWNGSAPLMIRQLDKYVAPGSTVTVVADPTGGEAGDQVDLKAQLSLFESGLHNVTVSGGPGNTTSRATLADLDISRFDRVIVLAYSDLLDPEQADARTLVTLLHLRDIKTHHRAGFSITSEMLNERNRELAEVTEADDFIVSGNLYSLLMSQLALNKYLHPLYEDLLSPEGSEIYLKPASLYAPLDTETDFYAVTDTALRRGEIAIGYRRHADAHNPARAYGVVLNPPKSQQVKFANGDRIIVVAED